jgi:membrane protease YdiL (CAAX protease family)
MTPYQQTALLLTLIWSAIVVVRFRRSSIVLIGGLLAIALYTLAAFAAGEVTLDELGLGAATPWFATLGFAIVWLGLMIAFSPLADRLATRFVAAPPTLESFAAIQQSRGRLIAGVLAAWALGGVLEELVARGILLQSVEALLSAWLAPPVATGVAICAAAIGAGAIHLYQGPRAMLIITQLSVLFGLLFVVSGHNLWAVMICHGLYDTIAFVRFANKKSKYSKLDRDSVSTSVTR